MIPSFICENCGRPLSSEFRDIAFVNLDYTPDHRRALVVYVECWCGYSPQRSIQAQYSLVNASSNKKDPVK